MYYFCYVKNYFKNIYITTNFNFSCVSNDFLKLSDFYHFDIEK